MKTEDDLEQGLLPQECPICLSPVHQTYATVDLPGERQFFYHPDCLSDWYQDKQVKRGMFTDSMAHSYSIYHPQHEKQTVYLSRRSSSSERISSETERELIKLKVCIFVTFTLFTLVFFLISILRDT